MSKIIALRVLEPICIRNISRVLVHVWPRLSLTTVMLTAQSGWLIGFVSAYMMNPDAVQLRGVKWVSFHISFRYVIPEPVGLPSANVSSLSRLSRV